MANSADFKVKNSIVSPYIKEFGKVKSAGDTVPSALIMTADTHEINTYLPTNYYIRGWEWSPDGTSAVFTFYSSSSGSQYVYGGTFSTPFDFSTYSYYGGIGTSSNNNYGVRFNNDGTKAYSNRTSNYIFQMNLNAAQPYRFNYLSGNLFNFSGNAGFSSANAFDFNADGTILYVFEYNGNRVAVFNLDTAWNLSSGVVHDKTVYLYKADGTNATTSTSYGNINYIPSIQRAFRNMGGRVQEYYTPTDDPEDWLEIGGKNITNSVNQGGIGTISSGYLYNIFFNPTDYSRLYYSTLQGQIGSFDCTSKRCEIDFNQDSVVKFNASLPLTFQLSNPPKTGTLSQSIVLVEGGTSASYQLPPDKVTTAELEATEEYIDLLPLLGWSAGDEPNGIYFKSDGTKAYLAKDYNSVIYEVDLATPWEISTATYSGVSYGTGVTGFAAPIKDIGFKSNGSVLYVMDNDGVMYHHNLTTPWDLSTASYGSKSYDFGANIDANYSLGSITGFKWSPDGNTLFMDAGVTTSTTRRMFKYDYSSGTAWDISSTFTRTNTVLDTGSTYTTYSGFDISSNGEYIAVTRNTAGVNIMTVSPAFTGSIDYNNKANYNSGGTHKAVRFSDDGNYFFTTSYVTGGITEMRLNRYTTSKVVSTMGWNNNVSFSDPEEIETPAPYKTNIFTVSTVDGGSSYTLAPVIKDAY